MSVQNYAELLSHLGHDIELVYYGELPSPDNVSIECETCNVVIIDFDHPELDEEED
jgi:hypothetical protein